jgi:hypothetical protein
MLPNAWGYIDMGLLLTAVLLGDVFLHWTIAVLLAFANKVIMGSVF